MISSTFIEKYKNHLSAAAIRDLTKNDSFGTMKEESIFELLSYELVIRGIIQKFDNISKPLLIMKLASELQSFTDISLNYKEVLDDLLDSINTSVEDYNKIKGA